MMAKVTRKVTDVGDGEAFRVTPPKMWADAVGLKGGKKVTMVFDEVLVLIPRRSAQAERVLAAMREGR